VLPWALAIAKRLMIDGTRRRRVELGLFARQAADEEERVASVSTVMAAVDDVLDASRLERRVRQRLDALPETQRSAYELVKQEGLSLKRAAELLGTSVTAVKLRTQRA
jgi:RNA polymerase sigma-70 factor (ECF subfamily)